MFSTVMANLWLWPDNWSVPDWVSVVGLPLAGLGIVLGLFQLRDAKSTAGDAKAAADSGKVAAEGARTAADTARNAATAARESIQATEGHLADNHLLLLIPRLDQIHRSLEAAVMAEDTDRVVETLNEWRIVAAHVRQLAQRQGGHENLVDKLQSASGQVHAAKEPLITRAVSPDEATGQVRKAIDDASTEAATLIGERMAFIRKGY